MAKKFLLGLFFLLLVGAGFVAFMVWDVSQGLPAHEAEIKYVTSADCFIEIDGARVRVREEGPAGAPVVILIHGFTHSLETWDDWATVLKSEFRVIRYDLLGHGLTGPDPKKRYSPQERANFIGAVMAALNVERGVLVGNSLGGLAAWRFAASHPESVDALVLISPGAFPLNGVSDTPAEIPAAMKAYLLTAPAAGVRASAEIIYGDDTKITEKRLTVMRDMIRRQGNGKAMVSSLKEFTLPDPSALLKTIKAPTLILWGGEDVVIPTAQGEEMEMLIPGAQLISYPGVGHAAQEEAPRRTVEDMIAFLKSLDGNRPRAAQ